MNEQTYGIETELEDYQAWKAGRSSFDLIDYLMCTGTPDGLVAMLELICPELINVDGDYFIKHNFSHENLSDWMSRLNDVREAQKVINHFHVSSFMQGRAVSNRVAVYVAKSIAGAWSRQFGGLGLVAQSSGQDLETAQVTMFRKQG